MKFPNLIWAIAERRMAHYQVASLTGLNESKFSRGLNGLVEFTAQARKKIAGVLGYPVHWLFKEVTPPVRLPSRDSVPLEPVECVGQDK